MEGPVRFELTTRGLKVHCSNRLSYGPKYSITLSVFQGKSQSLLGGAEEHIVRHSFELFLVVGRDL
jgi:hypothetical protein